MSDDRTQEEKEEDEDLERLDAELGGPNQELYDRLREPFAKRSEADASLNGFLVGLKRLREEFHIPEVVVVAGAFFTPAEGQKETFACKALGLGSPDGHAQLGALAFQQYTAPEIERGEKLRQLATARPKSRR